MSDIRLEIAKYMDEKGIKQRFLSANTGLSLDIITKSLRCKRRLEVNEYAKICDSLDVSLDYFYSRTKVAP